MLRRLENLIAAILLASRWLMAPLYFGLVIALLVIVVVFFRGLIQAIVGFAGTGGGGTILAILKLIDLILLGNLILIIIGAGVDILVSERVMENRKRPEWMGNIDFGALKVKIIASIIAIAAVYLLEIFFTIDQQSEHDVFWSILIFMSFVVGGVLLAWMDRLTAFQEHQGRARRQAQESQGDGPGTQ
jgi:uncharacterized protein (TIGR00645 family)